MGKYISDKTREEIFTLQRRGLSAAEISAKTRLSLSTVDTVLGHACEAPSKKQRTIDTRKRASWLKMQGWRLEEIERVTRIPAEDIEKNWKKWALKYGIPLPEPRPVIPPPTHGPVKTYKLINGELVLMSEENVEPTPNLEYYTEDELYE